MDSTPPVEEELLEVPFPFNRPNANIILRTADRFDFRLQRQILLEASPVFGTILSLPQPHGSDGGAAALEVPVIDVSESAKVLNALMRICYPIVKPKSRPFQQIEPVLRAALKYEMELPIAMLSDELLAYAVHSPLKVWAIACRTGLEDVARRAAELTLPSATLDIIGLEDTDGISAGHVFRLHEFHRLRGKVDFSFKLLTPPLSDGPALDEPSLPTRFAPDVPNPDVVLISSDEVDFHVHRGVVSAASTLLKAQLDDALRAVCNDSNEASSSTVTLPKLSVDVPATVLASLLKLSYPGGSDVPSDPSHVVELLQASERLGMDHVHRAILDRWSAIASQSPILAFLYATRAGLTACAKEAAKFVLDSDFEGVYIRDMELAPPLPYHRLLMHYRSCREIAKSILSDVSSRLLDNRYYHWHDHRRSLSPSTSVPDSHIVIQPPYGSQHAPSATAWLKKHLEHVSDTLERTPGRVVTTTEELVEAASAARQWCSSCQSLATNICRVGTALRDIPVKVKDVEFEL